MSRPKHIKETAFEFLARTISEHNSDKCLVWPFYCDQRHGYGILVTPFTKNVQKAHRVAYLLAYGEWPNPLGRHTCNNPPCYNPRHIVPGTDADNAADCVRAGRHRGFPCGSHNPATKVSAQLAAQIRERYEISASRTIAAELGISHRTVLRVAKAENLKFGKPFSPHKHVRGTAKLNAKLTDAEVFEIRASTERKSVLARRYGVSHHTVGAIKSGLKWKHLLYVQKEREASRDASPCIPVTS